MTSHAYAPAALFVRGPDGREARVLERGARLPASRRLVFATERPGQRTLELALLEGGEAEARRPLAGARCALPPALPANCWLQVYVEVDNALTLRVRVRENLRRLDLEAELDGEPAAGCFFRPA